MNNIYQNRHPEDTFVKSPLEGGRKFILWNPMDIPLGGGSVNIKTLIIELTEPLCRPRRLLPLRREADMISQAAKRFFPPVPAKYNEAVRTSCKKRQNDGVTHE